MPASVISGLRFPVALAVGLLFTTSLYWVLWSLTDATFDTTLIEGQRIEFTRQVKDTVVETKSREKVARQPPRVVEQLPPIGSERVGPAREVVYIPPQVAVTGPDIGAMTQGIDRDPVPLVRVQPDYPQRAAAAGIEGWVKVQFNISAAGAVTGVFVVESEPGTTFDNAAVNAVARWRYNPKVESAVAVERVGMQTIIRFNLEDE